MYFSVLHTGFYACKKCIYLVNTLSISFEKKHELILVKYCVNKFFLILKEFINFKYWY